MSDQERIHQLEAKLASLCSPYLAGLYNRATNRHKGEGKRGWSGHSLATWGLPNEGHHIA
jgi:hypothetical protein